MPSELYTQIHKTAQAFVQSYDEDKCGKDIHALSATLTPDCRRYFAPATLLAHAPVLKGGRTNEEYEQQMLHEIAGHESWKIEILDTTVDEEAHKAVVQTCTTVRTKRGKEYPFEFIYTLFTTADGKKVEKVMQFVEMSVAMQFLKDEQGLADNLK